MGFMAGFGEGFSTAFNNAQNNKAAQEKDAFAVAYNNYMKNKDQYDKDQKDDQKAIQTAKDIVQSTPGVNPAAWTYAYKWLKDGFSPDQIEQKLTTTTFSDIPKPQPATVAAPLPIIPTDTSPDTSNNSPKPYQSGEMSGTGTSTANPTPTAQSTMPTPANNGAATPPLGTAKYSPSSLDKQMSDSGMSGTDPTVTDPNMPTSDVPRVTSASVLNDPTVDNTVPPPTGAQPAQAQSPTPKPSNMLGSLGQNVQDKISEIGNPKVRQQHMIAGANQQVMDNLGVNQDQFNQVNSGYKPQPVTDTVQAQATPADPLAEFGLNKGAISAGDLARTDAQAATWLQSGNPDLIAKAHRYVAIASILHTAVEQNSKQDPNADPSSPINIQKVLQPTDIKSIADLATKKSDVWSMKQSADNISTLLAKHGPLNTWAAQGMTVANNMQTQFAAVTDAMSSIINSNPTAANDIQTFQANVAQWMDSNGWTATSEAERQLQSEFTQFWYTYAKTALGQSGQSLNAKDVENAKEIIMNSPNPEEAINRLKQLVGEAATNYNHQLTDTVNASYGIQEALKLEKDGILAKSIGSLDLNGDIGQWVNSKTPANISLNPNAGKTTQSKTATEHDVLQTQQAVDMFNQNFGTHKKLNDPYTIYSDGTGD